MLKELCKVITILESINKGLLKPKLSTEQIQKNKERLDELTHESNELNNLLNKLSTIDLDNCDEIETELINLHIKVLFYSSLVDSIGNLTKTMAENYNKNHTELK